MPRLVVRTVQKLLAAEPLLRCLECRLDEAAGVDLATSRPLFIVGAPRTGSTLLYELLVCRFAIAYFPNVAELCLRSPVIVTRLCRNGGLRHRFGGRSRFGVIRGLMAPSEAGQLMRHWIGEADNVPRRTSAPHRERVRAMVRRMSKEFGGPLITKDLFNSIRINTIRQLLPEAVFLHVRRDPRYTAQSILRARQQIWGDEHRWLGVRALDDQVPSGADPARQVVWQIRAVDDYIKSACHTAFAGRRIEVHYEQLCADPQRTLNGIAERLHGFGVELRDNPQTNELTLHTECANRTTMSDERWTELESVVDEIYGDSVVPADDDKCAATSSEPTG